jgi:hypothetical protein
MEDEIWMERSITPNWEVEETITNWFLDVVHSRGWETKNWKTVELYWHLKTLIGQILQAKEGAQDNIQLQLDE